jgi:hypothetical protein
VDDNPMEIAKFVNSTKKLNSEQKEKLFKEKYVFALNFKWYSF